ncbi:MAG: glutamate-cysteine ligase family protein [Nakamurella sp.]
MRTVGIEEEVLVVSSDTMRPLAVGDQVVADVEARLEHDQVQAEFKKEQVELGSAPQRSTAAIGGELHRLRTEMSQSADRQGARVVAIASSPFKVRPTISAREGYAEITERLGLLARQQLTCGHYVHVSNTSPDEGVADLGMMCFDARLSSQYPTVEVRVPDVCVDISDALLIAALTRGLVDAAIVEWRCRPGSCWPPLPSTSVTR